jgi:ribosomal-protein-alanine N-acetyltransferase
MSERFVIDRMLDVDVPGVAAMDEVTRMTEDQVREELARAWTRSWVAREKSAVVGVLLTWHVADELHVMNVATRPDRRRRGIAHALMKEAVGYAQEHGIKHVLLEVRRGNAPAIALYRAFGFFAMGVRARYYPDDEDAVEMVLLFDDETREIVEHADEVRLV